MATIASLNAKLGLSASGFFSTLGKVKTQLTATQTFTKRLSSGFSKLSGVLGGFGVALSAGGIVTGLGLLVNKSAQTIDQLSKMSRATGVSTEDLGRLKYAGDLAGISIDELGPVLGKFNKLLGEANNGSKTANAAFVKLGLSSAALSTLSPYEALGLVADKLNAIGSISERSAAASDIFGKQWQDMAGILELGSRGLNDLGKEAENAGLLISKMDAAGVEEANDAITKLKSTFEALGNQIAIASSKNLTEFANDLTKTFGTTHPNIKLVVDGVFELLSLVKSLSVFIINVARVIAIPFQQAIAFIGYVTGAVGKLIELLGFDFGKALKEAAFSFSDGIMEYTKNFASSLNPFSGDSTQEAQRKQNQKIYEEAKRSQQALIDLTASTQVTIQRVQNYQAPGMIDPKVMEEATKQATAIDDIFADLQDKLANLSMDEKLLNQLEALGASGADIAAANNLLYQINKQATDKQKLLDQQKLVEANKADKDKAKQDLASAVASGVQLIDINSNKGQSRAAGLNSERANPLLTEAKKQTRYAAQIANNTAVTNHEYNGL